MLRVDPRSRRIPKSTGLARVLIVRFRTVAVLEWSMDKADQFGLCIVVDDDEDVLTAARLALRGLFRKVVTLSTPDEAVRVIRRAGGVPVLAHPGLAARDEMIPELVAAGLAGIETYYPEHSVAQINTYRALCRRYGLVATGGSDYHGAHTCRTATLGSPAVPSEVWPELQQKARELQLGAV